MTIGRLTLQLLSSTQVGSAHLALAPDGVLQHGKQALLTPIAHAVQSKLALQRAIQTLEHHKAV